MERCGWHSNDILMTEYHDKEWGVPLHDDIKLFEFIILDAFQAGLNWATILKKRENFRLAFDGFDPEKIVLYDKKKFEELMNDAGIIRNKMKIAATINNAKAYLEVKKEFGTFDKFIWQFTNHKTVINKWKTLEEVPPSSEISDQMSAELKKRGFSFVGTTICYAFMQAAGMVNDHLTACYRYKELKEMK